MGNITKIREEVWESVTGLSDGQLNEVVEKGKWTISQVLEHLYLMEENVAHNIKLVLLSKENNPTDEKPIHTVVDRTNKRDAPDYLIPSNDFQTLEELKKKLANSRETLLKSIEGVSEEDLNEKAFIHRRFGLLTIKQWVSLIGYHEKRHLEQIKEIKQALKISIKD